MQQLHDLYKDIRENGKLRSTRSGDVTSVFHRDFVHDMRTGLPFPTTKKLQIPSVIAELQLFISGKSDRRIMQECLHGDFDPDRWDIWKQDCVRASQTAPERFNGLNLGDMYPVTFRKLYRPSQELIRFMPVEDRYADYIDPDKPTDGLLYGIGYNQDYEPKNITEYHLVRIWTDFIYASSITHITVSPRWHNLETFIKDAYCLPNFQQWVSGNYKWKLDHFYYNPMVIAPDTCIFTDLMFLSNHHIIDGIKYASSHPFIMRDVLHRLGHTVEDIEDKPGEPLYRPRLFIDQLQNVVDQMKNNPNSRYMIVDNWNPNHANESVLGACHNTFQIYVDGDYFDLDWTQRSVDTFLGLSFNIASYAVLMLILEKLTGLKPRYLYGSLKDTHIYEAHREAIIEQLSREPKNQSITMDIPDISNLDDVLKYSAKDFVVKGYEPDAAIKAQLLVG